MLLKSILYSVQVYWSNIFILPKKAVKEAESKSNAFLWSGTEDNFSKTKIKWDAVCNTKKEGGLGLRRIGDWNKAAIMRNIWTLFAKDGFIWVAWVNAYLLRGRSFWSLDIPSDCSWGWRKMLKLRSIARSFLKFEIGNGRKAFLWQDNWHPMGTLVLHYDNRIIYDSASNKNAKVASVICGSDWSWPAARSNDLVEIHTAVAGVVFLAENQEDKVIWIPSKNGHFHFASTWDMIRQRQPMVNWYHLIWFPKAIPKHGFIAWLAIHNRLSTRARQLNWGYAGNPLCLFCSQVLEDRDHVFFGCSFTRRLWRKILQMCLISRRPKDWNGELSWAISTLKGKSFYVTLVKLAWSAFIYHVWLDRNARGHQSSPKSEEDLLHAIVFDVRARLMQLEIKDSVKNRALCTNWLLPNSVL